MAEKYPIKAIQENKQYRAVTTVGIKKYFQNLGMMTADGNITAAGDAYAEYRKRKTDGVEYLAITKGIARKYTSFIKHGGK